MSWFDSCKRGSLPLSQIDTHMKCTLQTSPNQLHVLYLLALLQAHHQLKSTVSQRLCKQINIRPFNQDGYLSLRYDCELCLILFFKTAFQAQTEFGLYKNPFGTIEFFSEIKDLLDCILSMLSCVIMCILANIF